MELMQFKSYTWPYNPVKIEITLGRDLRTRQARGFGTIISDWGQTGAKIQGEGEFFGGNFRAHFESLKVLGEGPLHTLRYAFSFVEDMERKISGGNSLSMGGVLS